MDQYRAMALAISNCNLKLKSAAVATCRSTTVASPSILPPRALRLGRRALLGVFLYTSAALPAAAAADDDSRSLLLQKYLKKSQENKTKNDKERLESYYKRNYKDYFELFEGSLKGKDQLSDTEKEILDWLQKNK